MSVVIRKLDTDRPLYWGGRSLEWTADRDLARVYTSIDRLPRYLPLVNGDTLPQGSDAWEDRFSLQLCKRDMWALELRLETATWHRYGNGPSVALTEDVRFPMLWAVNATVWIAGEGLRQVPTFYLNPQGRSRLDVELAAKAIVDPTGRLDVRLQISDGMPISYIDPMLDD